MQKISLTISILALSLGAWLASENAMLKHQVQLLEINNSTLDTRLEELSKQRSNYLPPATKSSSVTNDAKEVSSPIQDPIALDPAQITLIAEAGLNRDLSGETPEHLLPPKEDILFLEEIERNRLESLNNQ